MHRPLTAALLAIAALIPLADAQLIQPGTPPGIFIQTQENTTLLGTQNKDKVQITGGTLDGTPIGSITPSTGVFTNLTFSGATISGNVTIGGTLGVTGATTLGSLTAGTTSVGALTAGTTTLGATTLGATTAASLALTSPLTVSSGGTGRATLTNHGLLIGAGTTAITQLGVGSTGTVLIGNTGADPSFTASPSLTSLTLSGALTAGSAALTTALPVSSGGTGLASGTQGGVLYYATSGALASSAALTQNRLIVGGGPGNNYAPISLADQGTATKLLHGNPWGPPTWSALANADIPVNTVGLDKLANQSAPAIPCVTPTTGGPVLPCTPGQLAQTLCKPNVQSFTTGTAATYTTPTCNNQLPTSILIKMVGGGGGGAGSGTTPGAAGAGTASTWSSPALSAGGGSAGSTTNGTGAAGGTTTGCDVNQTGATGERASNNVSAVGGGHGGASAFFTARGLGGAIGGQDGSAASANSGAGGGGASSAATANTGGGGGGGGGCEHAIIASTTVTIAPSYTYTVGALGAAGTAGGGGNAGGAGAAGILRAEARWQ